MPRFYDLQFKGMKQGLDRSECREFENLAMRLESQGLDLTEFPDMRQFFDQKFAGHYDLSVKFFNSLKPEAAEASMEGRSDTAKELYKEVQQRLLDHPEMQSFKKALQRQLGSKGAAGVLQHWGLSKTKVAEDPSQVKVPKEKQRAFLEIDKSNIAEILGLA